MSNPNETASASPEADEDSEICLEEALDEARECLSVGNYDMAINIVELLFESNPEQYNPEEELRLENAPLYFVYGAALLQSAKLQEHDVLTQVVKQMTDNPEHSGISKEHAALLANSVMSTTTSSSSSSSSAPSGSSSAATLTENDDETDLNPKTGAQNVEVETFELAWEWLDFARVIYQKALNGDFDKELTDALKKKYNLAMAEVLLMLGQLGMELENTEIYLKDLGDSLELRKENLDLEEEESKFLLAESYVNLATGQQLSGDPEGALRSLYMATELHRATKDSERKEKLKKQIDQGVSEAQRMASDTVDSANKEEVSKMIHYQIQSRSMPSTADPAPSSSTPSAQPQTVTLMAPRKKNKRPAEADADEEPSLKKHQSQAAE